MQSQTKPIRRGVEAVLFKLVKQPVWLLIWPIVRAVRFVNRHFLQYLFGHVMREDGRVYRIKFIWYADSVYLHPMIWGSVVLYALADAGVVASGWLLLIWLSALVLCYVTIIYNFNVIKSSILVTVVLALLGGAYFSTVEWHWNPLRALASHLAGLDAQVSPGFFLASAYVFFALIISEVVWAWLFHRVEIDESYVYEHQCLQGTSREPIFARGLKRETKDLLELLLLGAADIQHRTRNGVKRFKNVPFASLWLGSAIDSLLDVHRAGQSKDKKQTDEADQVRITDAIHDEMGDEELDDADDVDADADDADNDDADADTN